MNKGLEALAELYSYIKPGFDYQTAKAVEDYKIIEKELKALEIIRNRCVNTYDEIFSCDTYEEYKSTYHYSQEKFNLTEEEWKLLKEVLLWDIH